jgi:hypothetical protein
LSGTGSDVVTPELVLVDSELAKAQRKISERKAAMSSSEPSNGTFFIDPAQGAPPAVNAEPVVPVPTAAPLAPAAETPASAPAPGPLAVDESTPMRDVPLGTLIFRAGLLAEEQLEDALQEGMRNGKRLGEVLLERGWLHERDLGRLLAGQKGLPFVEVRASDAEPAALQMLPEEKARMQNALPLRYEDGHIVVAVADPSNELMLENLRRALGSEPKLVVAPNAELIRAIGEAYAGGAPLGATQQESTVAQEPTLQPAPIIEPGPTFQPEPSLQPAPMIQPEPMLQPEPTLQPEPVPQQEQPATAPVVTALPTVVPPAQTHDAHTAGVPFLEQPMVEPAAEAIEQPLDVAPMTAPAPTVEEIPAPLLEQPALQPEPPIVPEAITPPAPPPVEPQPAPVEPLAPVAPLQPPVEVVEPQPAPEAPPEPLIPPAAEHPVETVAPLLASGVAVPVEAPAVNQQPGPGPASLHIVLLRLRDGEVFEVGTFESAAEASTRAQDVVRQISTAEGDGNWPFFANRYLRPDTIVSIDLLEESADKWLGSSARSRWANPE